MKTKELIKKLEVVFEDSTLGDIPLIIKELKRDLNYFEITSICKDDLIDNYSKAQIDSLTDDDMENIASEMADHYCDNGFWEDLKFEVDRHLEDK